MNYFNDYSDRFYSFTDELSALAFAILWDAKKIETIEGFPNRYFKVII